MFKTSIKQTFKDADLLVSHKRMIRIKIADPWQPKILYAKPKLCPLN